MTEQHLPKLGKKLGVVHDPRTIMAESVLLPIKPPPSHRVAATLHHPPMYANAEYGDCTCASQGHRIMAQQRSSGQHESVQVTDEDVLAVYSAVTGFRPNDPSTDNGAYELDILNYMRRVGMGKEHDGTPHTIGAFVKVDHSNHDLVKRAHYVFGGLKVCAALPISAQHQSTWDVVSGSDARPGSWGGHSMYSPEYTSGGVVIFTWGAEKAMTWRWWDKYVDEVYALVTEDFLNRLGKTPQGFDQQALLDQLQAL